jgi:hypothetical protein
MVEVKVLCSCGTKYKFEVEPVRGRMPSAVQCPACGADGTVTANEYLACLPGVAVPAVEASAASSVGTSAPAPSRVAAPPVAPPLAMTPTGSGGSGLRLSGAAPAETGAVPGATFAPTGPQPLLQRTVFFVRERVAVLKLVDTFDILDPANGQTIGIAKEEPPGWAKWLRLIIDKRWLPTAANVYEREGEPPVLSIHRGFTFLRSKVRVSAGGQSLGYFKSKLISLGGGFHVYDNQDQAVAEVKGDWKGWNFRFLSQGRTGNRNSDQEVVRARSGIVYLRRQLRHLDHGPGQRQFTGGCGAAAGRRPGHRHCVQGREGIALAHAGHIIFKRVSAISLGVAATPMPATLKASILAWAVPFPPLTIAPA